MSSSLLTSLTRSHIISPNEAVRLLDQVSCLTFPRTYLTSAMLTNYHPLQLTALSSDETAKLITVHRHAVSVLLERLLVDCRLAIDGEMEEEKHVTFTLMTLASAPLTDCAKAWLRHAIGPDLVRSLKHILAVYSKNQHAYLVEGFAFCQAILLEVAEEGHCQGGYGSRWEVLEQIQRMLFEVEGLGVVPMALRCVDIVCLLESTASRKTSSAYYSLVMASQKELGWLHVLLELLTHLVDEIEVGTESIVSDRFIYWIDGLSQTNCQLCRPWLHPTILPRLSDLLMAHKQRSNLTELLCRLLPMGIKRGSDRANLLFQSSFAEDSLIFALCLIEKAITSKCMEWIVVDKWLHVALPCLPPISLLYLMKIVAQVEEEDVRQSLECRIYRDFTGRLKALALSHKQSPNLQIDLIPFNDKVSNEEIKPLDNENDIFPLPAIARRFADWQENVEELHLAVNLWTRLLDYTVRRKAGQWFMQASWIVRRQQQQQQPVRSTSSSREIIQRTVWWKRPPPSLEDFKGFSKDKDGLEVSDTLQLGWERVLSLMAFVPIALKSLNEDESKQQRELRCLLQASRLLSQASMLRLSLRHLSHKSISCYTQQVTVLQDVMVNWSDKLPWRFWLDAGHGLLSINREYVFSQAGMAVVLECIYLLTRTDRLGKCDGVEMTTQQTSAYDEVCQSMMEVPLLDIPVNNLSSDSEQQRTKDLVLLLLTLTTELFGENHQRLRQMHGDQWASSMRSKEGEEEGENIFKTLCDCLKVPHFKIWGKMLSFDEVKMLSVVLLSLLKSVLLTPSLFHLTLTDVAAVLHERSKAFPLPTFRSEDEAVYVIFIAIQSFIEKTQDGIVALAILNVLHTLKSNSPSLLAKRFCAVVWQCNKSLWTEHLDIVQPVFDVIEMEESKQEATVFGCHPCIPIVNSLLFRTPSTNFSEEIHSWIINDKNSLENLHIFNRCFSGINEVSSESITRRMWAFYWLSEAPMERILGHTFFIKEMIRSLLAEATISYEGRKVNSPNKKSRPNRPSHKTDYPSKHGGSSPIRPSIFPAFTKGGLPMFVELALTPLPTLLLLAPLEDKSMDVAEDNESEDVEDGPYIHLMQVAMLVIWTTVQLQDDLIIQFLCCHHAGLLSIVVQMLFSLSSVMEAKIDRVLAWRSDASHADELKRLGETIDHFASFLHWMSAVGVAVGKLQQSLTSLVPGYLLSSQPVTWSSLGKKLRLSTNRLQKVMADLSSLADRYDLVFDMSMVNHRYESIATSSNLSDVLMSPVRSYLSSLRLDTLKEIEAHVVED
eukprot:gene7051-7797_t